jgi:serine/threonine-protein phosphatase 2A regulatory subunit B
MYHINAISVNSDRKTYLPANDPKINLLWPLEVTHRCSDTVDIKPANREEVVGGHCCHGVPPAPGQGVHLSKWTIRVCDMISFAGAIGTQVFEEPEDHSCRSFLEIISSIRKMKFRHCEQYMMIRGYLSVKVWDLNVDIRPLEIH